jgi:predicted ATP-binding protein involved in virulence
MRIDTLYLKNFRNVAEATLHFNPQFSVLIGINGRGKSTWLHGLRVACGAYLLGIPDAKKRHIIPTEIRRKANGVLIKQLPVIVEATGIPDVNATQITWRREITEGKRGTSYSTKDVGEVRNLGRKKYDRMMETGAQDLNLPLIAFFGTARLHGAARNQTASRIGREIYKEGYDNWFDMRASSFKYDSWLHTYDALVETGKEHPESKPAFFEALKTANPYITKINFVSSELWVQVQMDNYTSEYLPIGYHSDGVKAFTEMTAELAYRCIVLNGDKRALAINETAGLVMIDELDLHLHPNWQRHVVSDLKKAFPKLQFVATTHSPFIVQSLAKDELINLDPDVDGVDADPFSHGIEDVAELEMGVKDIERSQAFNDRVEVASEYYRLIAEGKTSKEDQKTAELRAKLNEMEARFSDDPAFVATLQLEREAANL